MRVSGTCHLQIFLAKNSPLCNKERACNTGGEMSFYTDIEKMVEDELRGSNVDHAYVIDLCGRFMMTLGDLLKKAYVAGHQAGASAAVEAIKHYAPESEISFSVLDDNIEAERKYQAWRAENP